MKSKIAIFFDTLFICFIIFVIIYFWLMKLIKNAFLSLFCSISLSILIFFFVFKFSIKKFKLNKISIQDQKFARKCFEKLRYLDSTSSNKFYETLLDISHINGNIFNGTKSVFYISTKHILTDLDFMTAYDYYLTNKINSELSFISSEVSESFTKLVQNSPIKINMFSETDLFLIMKEKNLYPEAKSETQNNPKKFSIAKTKLTSSITRTHFKEFFFSGLSLIFISVVIPFSTYYLIFGSILLLLSLISLFIKNKTPANILLDKNLSTLIKDVTNK